MLWAPRSVQLAARMAFTQAQLDNMRTLDDVAREAAIPTASWSTFLAALGGPVSAVEAAFILEEDWSKELEALRVTADDQERPLNPLEKARFLRARRGVLILAGLVSGVAPPAGGGHSGSTAPEAPTVPQQPAARKVKLSSLLDLTAEADLVSMKPEAIRKAFEEYKATRGDYPHKDVEPTADQLSAICQQIAAGVVPYADFSLFGPHGRRTQRRLMLASHTFHAPSNTWTRVQLPGPPDFDTWWKSWLTYRCALLLLKAARAEPLELYGEHVRSLHNLYGPRAWHIIYQADTRMRAEEFERIRRQLEIEHAAVPVEGYDPDMPWNSVILRSVGPAARDFWDTEVRDKALFQSAADLARSVEATANGKGARRRQDKRTNDSVNPQAKKQRGAKGGKEPANRENQVCFLFTQGRCSEPCPHGRLHPHQQRPQGDATEQPAAKGKGKGKDKGKKGGKR